MCCRGRYTGTLDHTLTTCFPSGNLLLVMGHQSMRTYFRGNRTLAFRYVGNVAFLAGSLPARRRIAYGPSTNTGETIKLSMPRLICLTSETNAIARKNNWHFLQLSFKEHQESNSIPDTILKETPVSIMCSFSSSEGRFAEQGQRHGLFLACLPFQLSQYGGIE